jgi:hypothetical protein
MADRRGRAAQDRGSARQGPVDRLCRIGMMRALGRHQPRTFDATRKEPRWGRRKLARDQ